MTYVFAVLNALVAIKGLADYVVQLAGYISLWWVQKQNAQTLQEIADAAAFAAAAETDEDRFKASDGWHRVFLRPRVKP